MTYHDICESNRGLYTSLEQLSHDIAYCERKQLSEDAEQLRKHWKAIMSLIDINLDNMEKLWYTMGTRRPAERESAPSKPTKLEEKIIMSFIHNEDKRESTIACSLNVKAQEVKKTINKYLQGHFLQVA